MDNDQNSALQERYPFRVFISYSHADSELVGRMAAILEGMGLQPLWDRDIHPGTPFTDEIKDLIARSHLFIPVITRNAQERPWVHQETGYAQAINIPIVPITFAGQGLPSEMIAQLQAITVQPGLEDLAEQLEEANIERLVLPAPRKPRAIIDVADWPETRAELMCQHIQWVTDLEVCGQVRHRAASTTFSIPDREINDPIWKARDGFYDGVPARSDYFYHLQLQERRALERHATQCGCSLMMGQPEIIGESRGPMGRRVRLESLLEFFDRMTDDNLKIIFLPQRESGNVVMVGDYFVAESVAGRTGGWLQTVFNSHPPTVLQRVRKFDLEFVQLYSRYGKSRQAAKDEIQKVLDTLPPFPF